MWASKRAPKKYQLKILVEYLWAWLEILFSSLRGTSSKTTVNHLSVMLYPLNTLQSCKRNMYQKS